jgi:hypothetical protein
MDKRIVRIRAFRAVDDFRSCRKFIEGHRKVLDNHGIDQVTSANDQWAFNPAVFVILVESLDGEKTYGGARIHVADHKTPLPIEEAVSDMDPHIYDVVKDYARRGGTGELCGLWNSIEVAGMGIGAFFSIVVGFAITTQVGITSVFSLCAPPTVKFAEPIGCRIVTSLGNKGTFYYPKIDLLATVVLLEDAVNLPLTNEAVKERIMNLRKHPVNIVLDKAPPRNIEIEIHYNLVIPGTNINEFVVLPQS